MNIKNFLLGVLALTVSGCAGYTALYQTDAPVTLGDITVLEIQKNVGERRTAQIMHQELSRRFPNKTGDRLDIQLERSIGTLAVRDDATVERSEYTLRANATLTDVDGKVFWSDSLNIGAAFSVEDNPLSTDVGKDYAAETAAISLSNEVARRVYDAYRNQARNQALTHAETDAE